MSALPKRRLTPQEYLAIERAAQFKSEFYNGEMFAMAGGTSQHSLIGSNLIVAVGQQLKGRNCRVFTGDLRVMVPAAGLYTYPDASVVCGKPEFTDEHQDNLLNPVALFEVLSRSTEAYDRGAKAEFYRQIASLREYVLIAQDRPHVEVFVRDGTQWSFAEFNGLVAEFRLPSIDCELALADVYDKIEFPPVVDAAIRKSS